jgi:hypothetical protein
MDIVILYCRSCVEYVNTRSVGKPRTRWDDVVQRAALHVLGIRGWKRRVGDREERGAFEVGQDPVVAVAPYMDGYKNNLCSLMLKNLSSKALDHSGSCASYVPYRLKF